MIQPRSFTLWFDSRICRPGADFFFFFFFFFCSYSTDALDKESLIKILTEPKNALVRPIQEVV